MKNTTRAANLSRRKFIVSSAATGGGLALGFKLPFIGSAEAATAAGAEVNAWVVVKPDSTCVIRIARSEMGQGTETGLAQLVAEELECGWNKVAVEWVAPGQNLARKRIWGDMATGGSRGATAAHIVLRAADAAAAAGRHVAPDALAREILAGRDPLHRYFIPAALELLGHQLGEPGLRALPHLRARDADHAGAVVLDDDPGVHLCPGGSCGLRRSDERKLESEREAATW